MKLNILITRIFKLPSRLRYSAASLNVVSVSVRSSVLHVLKDVTWSVEDSSLPRKEINIEAIILVDKKTVWGKGRKISVLEYVGSRCSTRIMKIDARFVIECLKRDLSCLS